ncbi:beta-ketoacyl synthase chain length factor [Methylomonas rosea]|uniref:Beta-ketoacyl synthase chain length factor n=1 Tax=Methylomonas rosea TaxID=2952227 RepID=A0ABT1TSV4_9GAMM|nr:beta-ketoacyl synthase chain length factor [Methylomonas sp. WSC-7]MCQ8117854.1 beta-ketoacyl synthase chain length factor [Methylomonas sp. WSC-7]
MTDSMDATGLERSLVFTLKHWCFWQSAPYPNLNNWPDGEILPYNQGNADVGFLPAMQRRRLSPLARAACAVAWRCRNENGDMPSVFFSNHGESQYYFEMLEDLAAGEHVSPSRFSQCVHNAIAGLSSFHSSSYLPYVALAGGSEGPYSVFLEAGGMLLDVPQVLVVWYEQPLPEVYRSYLPGSQTTWALAMTLARPGGAGRQLRLTREPANGPGLPENGLPNLVQAVVTGQQSGSCRLDRAIWYWRLDNVS